jgi:hypothetical protein
MKNTSHFDIKLDFTESKWIYGPKASPRKKFNQIYPWLIWEYLWALLDAIQCLNCIFLLKLFKISRQGMSREKTLNSSPLKRRSHGWWWGILYKRMFCENVPRTHTIYSFIWQPCNDKKQEKRLIKSTLGLVESICGPCLMQFNA